MDKRALIGKTISHYTLHELIAEGGMGFVYKGRDALHGRDVAVKVLPVSITTDPKLRMRFVREAQAASSLNHPAIVTVFDHISETNADYLVMEYLHGKTLDELIAPNGMPLALALRLGIEIASALQAAHQVKIVHRDVKPGNVFVTKNGHAKMLDFGAAKLLEGAAIVSAQNAHLTATGAFLGTPLYAAPEQISGDDVDWRADTFSFGVLLNEMVTGKRPFSGATRFAALNQVLNGQPVPCRASHPHLPEKLERLILSMVSRDREARPRSMNEVATKLARLVAELE